MHKKKTLSRRIGRLLIILLIPSALGGSGYWYLLERRTIPVRTSKIARGTFRYTVTSTSSGTLKAERVTQIASRINGRVIKVAFDEGDLVRKGQPLVFLDPAEATANVKMAQATLALSQVRYERAQAAYELEKKLVDSRIRESQARLTEAASTLKRAGDMMKQGIYSDEQLDSARKNYDVARAAHDQVVANRQVVVLKEKEMLAAGAEVRQLKESLGISQIQASYLVISAPFRGLVSMKDVELGEMVMPGVPLVEIVDDTSIYVSAPIDEADIHKIHVGQTAGITIDAYPGVKFTGRIYEIAPIVSEDKQEGRTVTIKIAVDPHHETLRPGMSCDIEILVDRIPGALLVPTNLLMGRGKKKYVFVVDKNIVRRRRVTPGLSNWDVTEVKAGLKEGEAVVSSIDILNLKEGSRVVLEKGQGS